MNPRIGEITLQGGRCSREITVQGRDHRAAQRSLSSVVVVAGVEIGGASGYKAGASSSGAGASSSGAPPVWARRLGLGSAWALEPSRPRRGQGARQSGRRQMLGGSVGAVAGRRHAGRRAGAGRAGRSAAPRPWRPLLTSWTLARPERRCARPFAAAGAGCVPAWLPACLRRGRSARAPGPGLTGPPAEGSRPWAAQARVAAGLRSRRASRGKITTPSSRGPLTMNK